MEKNSHYFVVGIFVSLAIVAGIFFIVWLAGTHEAQNYNHYTVNFSDPVSGLKKSAIVQFRGIEVGSVTDIRLSPNSVNMVNVDIAIDESVPINQSTIASLATLGITGITYIELTTLDNNKPALEKPIGKSYPIIPGQGTQLSKLFQDIPAISKQLLDLSQKINKAFDEDTITSLNQTVKNVEQMSADINEILSDENITNATITLRNVSNASGEMDQLVTRFDKTADEIDKVVGSLNEVITNNKQDINKFTGSGLNQITEMSRQTTDMAKAIRRLADRLEQDPSRILYQPQYRGVEVKE